MVDWQPGVGLPLTAGIHSTVTLNDYKGGFRSWIDENSCQAKKNKTFEVQLFTSKKKYIYISKAVQKQSTTLHVETYQMVILLLYLFK